MEITSFSYDPQRCKSPVYSVPLPPEFFPFLGQIVVVWSAFETMFETFLIAMQSASKSPPSRIEKGFPDRARQFQDLVLLCFKDTPEIAKALDEIVSDALAAQIDRNLIGHGKLATSSANGGELVASGRIKKNNITRTYKLEDIEAVFFALSYLAGRMFEFTLAGVIDISYLKQLTPHEKSFLRNFCLNNHPSHAKPNKP